MKIAIVGHGRSLKGAGLGGEIDAHDLVVRLKGSHTVMASDDFGYKADALCASTEIMGTFFKMDAKEYWAYPKNGDFDWRVAIGAIVKLGQPVMIPLEHSNFWNSRFRRMGAQHPNVSTGMAAIIFAIYRWSPKEIKLFGFDTLLDPEEKFDRHDEIPRSGHGAYPAHDWAMENRLLGILSNMYKVKIS